MKLEQTTTGLIIHNPDFMMKKKILQYFSLTNPIREYFIYSGNDTSKLPIFGKEHDVVYISSGFLNINDQYIQSLPRPSVIQPITPTKIELNMNRQPRSRLQEDCIKKMIDPARKSNKLTIELKPGTGKGHPYSTRIPTPTSQGYTLMGDLKVGDNVFDRLGQPTKVTGIFELGEIEVYKVTFQDGRISYCTGEHLWTVKSHKNGAWKTLMLKDMIRDFKRESPWKKAHGRKDPYTYKYYIPNCQPVEYPHKNVPIDPWVLGCFIGNGCCTCDQLIISSGTSDVPEKIANLYGFDVKRNPSNYNYGFYHKNGKPVYTKEFFKGLPEMIGCYSRDKKIPDIYMVNNSETRLRLLQGLMDTDGNISYNEGRYNVRLTSTSKILLEQVLQILYSFGYSGNIIDDSRGEEKYINGYCGTVIFRVPNSIKQLFFTIISKKLPAIAAADQKQENHYSDLLIKDISFSHMEKSRCIMVDNPEHLYLTEDFIVTHNTFIATYGISKLGLKPLIIAPTTLLKNQWCDEFEAVGIPRHEIATNIYDSPNAKLTVVTISSIENALRDDWEGLMNVINKSAFGIKVVDEAHLHLKGILKFDAICNMRHNWYLSATLGRSDVLEDNILNRALSDADRFIGNSEYEEYQKQYVNVFYQNIYYYPPTKLCMEHFRYGSKGLIKATYYNMLMNYNNGIPFLNNLIHMMKVAKKTITYDGKILLLVPLISIIERVIEMMENDPFFRQYSFAGVDGSMPISTKRQAMESDFILSTSLSMGTGVDVQNLAAVINFDQYSSPIIGEQIFGRLRDRGKETWYFDVADYVKQAKMFATWGRRRRTLIPYYPGACQDIKQLPDIKC